MSLGIAIKGPEGIVLAADSRVTLHAQHRGSGALVPAYFDNATKLLSVRADSAGQTHVGAVTYGLGAIGSQAPRTAHSYMPEFEAALSKSGTHRRSVEQFANELSKFFMDRWNDAMPKAYEGPDMVFLVGGFDEDAPYGKTFEISIPRKARPEERNLGTDFGITWGGQREFADRLLVGFDENLPRLIKETGLLFEDKANELIGGLRGRCQAPIPIQFLPLQDCVDLAIFLIRSTIAMQKWIVGVRGVGGDIDVATITREAGFVPVQMKSIRGE